MHRILSFVAGTVIALGFLPPLSAQQLAFPGAEGFGRYAIGGRGGEIYPSLT